MNAVPVAQLIGVSVSYRDPRGDEIHALRDVTLACLPGTSTAIVGRSGSGKSTLVSVLSLLRRPTSGRVLVKGQDVAQMSAEATARVRSTSVGIVFQAFHLEPHLTAAENVMLPWFFGSSSRRRADAQRHAETLLEHLGIADLARRRPSAMSGGQRQRVAIARALFSEPSLFIADEPTGNLDEETANDVAQQILSLSAQTGTCVVVVTHDRSVAAMADFRIELARGRFVEHGGLI